MKKNRVVEIDDNVVALEIIYKLSSELDNKITI